MKKFILLILFLFLNLQFSIKAEELSEFEIEGISIGDSLLKHFSKKSINDEIKSEFSYKYENSNWVQLGVGSTRDFPLFKKLDHFDELGITIKLDDKSYIVHGVIGDILCHNNIKKCMMAKDEIIKDLKSIFVGLKVKSWKKKHNMDKTGKSIVYGNTLSADTLAFKFSVSVYDMADDSYNDSTQLSIRTKELEDFIRNEAYKN
tara:strand:- start:702 stop:1313 length:612 start_codon:yes stop_codon:yes gene_type:complete